MAYQNHQQAVRCSVCLDLRSVIEDDDTVPRGGIRIPCPRCCCDECGDELVDDICPRCTEPELSPGHDIEADAGALRLA